MTIGQHSPTDPGARFGDILTRLGARIARLERAAAVPDVWLPVTSSATAGTGWTIMSFDAHVSASMLQFLLVVERTGPTITVPDGTGNITNETVATLPTECQGSVTYGVPISSGSTGRGAFATYVPSSGLVRLNAMSGPDDLAAAEQISLGGTVLIRPS